MTILELRKLVRETYKDMFLDPILLSYSGRFVIKVEHYDDWIYDTMKDIFVFRISDCNSNSTLFENKLNEYLINERNDKITNLLNYDSTQSHR